MAERSGEPPIYTLDVDSARRKMSSKSNRSAKAESVGSATDHWVDTSNGKIRVRVYQPVKGKGDGFCYVYYHGGGAVLFSIEEYDPLCRHLCNTSGATVVSVNYHLAPESRYPVQIEDAASAYQWTLDNSDMLSIDPNKISVLGDSFGAYLATEVCIVSNKRGFKCPSAQILLYPRTDHGRTDLESYKLYSSGYDLDSAEMEWYWKHYLPSEFDYDDPGLCPNRSKDLSFMPATYIYTAECDPLRDEGEEYASKMEKSGVHVKLTRVEGQIHGFIHLWDTLDTPRRILDEIAKLPVSKGL